MKYYLVVAAVLCSGCGQLALSPTDLSQPSAARVHTQDAPSIPPALLPEPEPAAPAENVLDPLPCNAIGAFEQHQQHPEFGFCPALDPLPPIFPL